MARLYTLPRCEIGGPLHVQLEDGNVDLDMKPWYTRDGKPGPDDWAAEVHEVCDRIEAVMTPMSEYQRRLVLSFVWPRPTRRTQGLTGYWVERSTTMVPVANMRLRCPVDNEPTEVKSQEITRETAAPFAVGYMADLPRALGWNLACGHYLSVDQWRLCLKLTDDKTGGIAWFGHPDEPLTPPDDAIVTPLAKKDVSRD